MAYEINIKEFSGPLDLLLHLIKQSNIDIMNINIEQITKQYLDYIEKMEELNLNIASEYLVMAAELIEIKSSCLLPREEDIESDEFEEDPKQQLIKRLLEYEQYKEITNSFKELEETRHEIYTKAPSDLLEFKDDNQKIDYGVSIDDLINALNSFLSQKELSRPLNTKVSTKEYSITKRSYEIKKLLKKKKIVNFVELFDVVTREGIVITLLSILSLSKKQEIEIEQDSNFKNIIIKEKGVK